MLKLKYPTPEKYANESERSRFHPTLSPCVSISPHKNQEKIIPGADRNGKAIKIQNKLIIDVFTLGMYSYGQSFTVLLRIFKSPIGARAVSLSLDRHSSPPSETLVHLKDVNCFQLKQEKEFVCDGRKNSMSCEALFETGSSLEVLGALTVLDRK